MSKQIDYAIVVEDDPKWGKIYNRELLVAGLAAELCDDLASARLALVDQITAPRLLVLDPNFDGALGLAGARMVMETFAATCIPGTPAVVVSGLSDEAVGREALGPFSDLVVAWLPKAGWPVDVFRAILRDALR